MLAAVEKVTWIIKPEKEALNKQLNALQRKYGNMKSFDKIQKGDMISILLQELDKDENPKLKGLSNTTSILVDKVDDKVIKNRFLKLKKK